MITIVMPEWLVWALIAMFFLQWIMNGILAYQERRSAESARNLAKTIEETRSIAEGHSHAFGSALRAVAKMNQHTETMQ